MITSQEFGDRGRRRAVKLGIDPERVPPGQSPTQKWPVLTIGEQPRVSTDAWSVEVRGAVEEPFAVRWDELLALEQVTVTRDIHCVTRWSLFDAPFTGVRVTDLLARARPLPAATHVMAHSFGGYTTNLPLADLLTDDVLIAHRHADEPLAAEHGGPARLLVASRYFWKSAKWICALELLEGDAPGFWEDNGYHAIGDPWREERYST